MTIQISGWSTSLTDLEICTLALCATIIVCTISALFVVVSVMVGVIENSTKRLIHAAWHGPNNAGMNLAHRLEKHFVGIGQDDMPHHRSFAVPSSLPRGPIT